MQVGVSVHLGNSDGVQQSLGKQNVLLDPP